MRYHYFAQRQINEYMSAMTAVMYSLFNNANGFEQVFNMSELPTQASFDADTSWYVNWMNEMIFWYEHAEMKRIDDIANYIEALANMARKYKNARIDHVQGIIDTVSILLQQYVNVQKVDSKNSQYVHLISTVYSLLQSCVCSLISLSVMPIGLVQGKVAKASGDYLSTMSLIYRRRRQQQQQ
ncbi:hypothetical protein RFI_38533 [Reticulomyxa filosa]|uniref:Uncharacterized protein n=1 Tax=Reticulomyxa filosa TaxID=46433 RepID=X6LE07_RETFI|nr:hypothetical protein RFI_38533 [Reticulomyxa filosa]|eukprot:ETN98954.1 hypothetical protein RFI_38533 [Reticulomyxa filosa]